jgi:hypothetical protein
VRRLYHYSFLCLARARDLSATGTAKNYQNSGDSKRPTKVRMAIDEGSCNPETGSQRHAQSAIHSPYIQNVAISAPLSGVSSGIAAVST